MEHHWGRWCLLWAAAGVMALLAAGCGGAVSAGPTVTATVTERSTVTLAPTDASAPVPSAAPTVTVSTPNEAAFVKAMAKVTPLYGEERWRDTVVDMGWNICKIVETLGRQDALAAANANPTKAEAYVTAATTYLCP